MFKRSSRKDIIKFGSNSCYFLNLKVRSILSIGINKPTLIESSLFYWAWLFFFFGPEANPRSKNPTESP